KYGIPECGSAGSSASVAQQPTTSAKSIYFSGTGDKNGGAGYQIADLSYPSSVLHGDNDCTMNANIPESVTTLAGWSRGRLGVLYALNSMTPEQRQKVTNIVLIDPGNTQDMQPCDGQVDANGLLADW